MSAPDIESSVPKKWLDTAADLLRKLEAENDKKPFKEIAAQLRAADYYLAERKGDDNYLISKTWTKRGIRHWAAANKLYAVIYNHLCELREQEGYRRKYIASGYLEHRFRPNKLVEFFAGQLGVASQGNNVRGSLYSASSAGER